MESLSSLKPLIIPRCYSPDTSQPTAIDLHVFGDASEPGFGAVAYLLFVYSDKCQNRVREGQISCLSAAVCLYSTLGAVRRFPRRAAPPNYQEKSASTDPTVRLLVRFDDRIQLDFFQELQVPYLRRQSCRRDFGNNGASTMSRLTSTRLTIVLAA